MRFDLRPGVRRFFRLALRTRARVHADVDDELESLIESRVEHLVARGFSPADARAEAMRRLGVRLEDARAQLHQSAEHEERRMRLRENMDSWLQDVRYAIRGLRLKPGFATAVVLTLALGVGANAAMFSIVDRLLFRPPAGLKHPELAHRVYLWRTLDGKDRASSSFQYARYVDLTRWTTSFVHTAVFSNPKLAIGTGDDAREMRIGVVSTTLFSFFDAPPALGRYFTTAEDSPPSGTPVAVLSYALWQTRYGGRVEAINSTLQIGSTRYTIVGVTPATFTAVWDDDPPAAYIPASTYAATTFASFPKVPNASPTGTETWYDTYHWTWLSMLVSRRPGVSLEAANADLSNAYRLSYRAHRLTSPGIPPIEVARPHARASSILSARGPNPSSVSKVATWVGGVALIVLLIACANVANLLVSRALRRQREIAVRLALGVSRARLLSQLLTESMLLALFGGIAGVLIAHWGGSALRAAFFTTSDSTTVFHDGRTLLFSAIAVLAAGCLTGLAPILQLRHADLTRDLKSGKREGTYSRGPLRVTLLVLQGALSVVLLVGAGLFVRSLLRVRAERLGYDVDPVLVVYLNMRSVKLDSTERIALPQRLLERAQSLPGVEHASLQTDVPFSGSTNFNIYVPGVDSVNSLGEFFLNAVTPDYFATMGTRILRGRGISDADRPDTPRAMVVSEAMATILWPGKNPIGQCVKLNAETLPCYFVVGVAQNIKTQSLRAATTSDKTGDAQLFYYLSTAQLNPRQRGLLVRVSGDAKQHVDAVRRALQQLMPGDSYVTVTPFSDVIGRLSQSWKLGATMFVAFGLLAVLLAAIGLYSVIAYNVAQRTHEMGVRIALGADLRDVVTLILGQGVRLSVIGTAIGSAVALWAGRWIQPLLFEESARDPSIYVGVAMLLLGIAVAASIIPAWRAARVDPNVALRSE